MKRAVRWVASLLAVVMIAGCTSAPVIHAVEYRRQEPTQVRSLLIVVDDTLFGKAYREHTGAMFSRTLGSTLKNTAGSIPVTLLQVDSEPDTTAMLKALMSSHATQVLVVKATHVRTDSRGPAQADWEISISDVIVTRLPDDADPSAPHIQVTTRTFYRDEVDATVDMSWLDFIDGMLDSNAQKMGMAIADKLRADHVLTPDRSPAPIESPSSLSAHTAG